MNFSFSIFATRVFAILLALFWLTPAARSAEVEVTASLTESSTEVGQPVEFQIKITGAHSANPPTRINVEGLSISYGGQSTQVQMNNFNVTMSVVHSYQVIPQRAGKFTIPAQTVEVGGKNYATPPVTLEAGSSPPNSSAAAPASNSHEMFAELIVPKQTAYVGEVIPVEFRVYVDTRIRWQTQQPPAIPGDGFTVQKLTKPLQNQVQRDGRVYDLVTFKTAITPAKSGQLTLGPAELDCIANLPQRHRRTGSPFDDFFNDDPFGNAFGLGQAQQIAIKSDPVSIEVKPLPTANQPKDFSGAVGLFTLTASAQPTKVKLGDPITLTAKITGRGNFDRVNAPQLSDEPGWRSYPPSGKFQSDDDVGISGTKTFETALIPDQPKTKLPAVRFSYFDPLQEKYVTLRGDQPLIVVEGQPAVVTPHPALAAAPPAGAPKAASAPAPNDILYLRTEETRWGQSFEPLYRTRNFWLAQLVPWSLLLAFMGVQFMRSRQRDASARQTALWRREKNETQKTLARRDASTGEFFDAAVRSVQLTCALRSGRAPELIDAREACATPGLPGATAEEMQALFAAQAEQRYAGFGENGGELSSQARAGILATLQRFEQDAAHV